VNKSNGKIAFGVFLSPMDTEMSILSLPNLCFFLLLISPTFVVPVSIAENNEVRQTVQLCRAKGKDMGIKDRLELREFIRECVEEQMAVKDESNPPPSTGVVEIKALGKEKILFDD
jgi:hypothetical protein